MKKEGMKRFVVQYFNYLGQWTRIEGYGNSETLVEIEDRLLGGIPEDRHVVRILVSDDRVIYNVYSDNTCNFLDVRYRIAKVEV